MRKKLLIKAYIKFCDSNLREAQFARAGARLTGRMPVLLRVIRKPDPHRPQGNNRNQGEDADSRSRRVGPTMPPRRMPPMYKATAKPSRAARSTRKVQK